MWKGISADLLILQVIKPRVLLGLGLGMAITLAGNAENLPNPLHPISVLNEVEEDAGVDLGYDSRIWGEEGKSGDWRSLMQAIDYSLSYLETPEAVDAYQNYSTPGITRDRVRRSLWRFRQLILTKRSPEELQAAIQREFVLYQSVGNDGEGTVDFTGYFEPTYTASRTPTAEYRYPLYRRPSNLEQWPLPHPTRIELEGLDGLQGSQGLLRGLELVWLRDRLEAFLIQVQGSARLQLPDGDIFTVGYAGRTEYAYTSIGRELVNDHKFRQEDLSLPTLIRFFQQNPDQLDGYLSRNQRFVFFQGTNGSPAIGTLSVPVTAGRSIATDKSVMPPGALALIHLPLPHATEAGEWEFRQVSRYVLDQDTGGAIRGAGRVDLFIGTGTEAGRQAGLINTSGQLYYLLLRED